MEKHYIALLKELIQNRCVNDGSPDSGHEIRSARTLKKFFDSYHIKSEILKAREERGNLLVRIPGTDPQAPSLMYMCHMDVVPADDVVVPQSESPRIIFDFIADDPGR